MAGMTTAEEAAARDIPTFSAEGWGNDLARAQLFFNEPVRGLADAGEGAIDTAATLGADILDKPVETLSYPLLAPFRTVQNYLGRDENWRQVQPGFAEEVFSGRPGHALDRGVATAISAGETALLATPARVPRAAPRGVMSRAAQDFEAANVEPFMAGVAAETPASGAFGRVTKMTGENPFAGFSVRGQMQRRQSQAATQSERLTDRFSPARTVEEGGDAVRSGVQRFSRETFPQQAKQRYADIRSRLNPGSLTSTSTARATLHALNNNFSRQGLNDLFANKKLRRLEAILQAGETGTALHFDGLTQLRTQVRYMRSNRNELRRPPPDADLARLEEALTEDLYAGVESAVRARHRRGDPAAGAQAEQVLADFQETNTWYRNTARMIAEDLERFNAASAELAFSRVRAAARAGGAGDLGRLRSLMTSLEPDARMDLAATVLRDMTSNGGRGFTPTSWATAWERMTPEAREILFGGPGGGQALANLETFYRVTRKMREVDRFTNFSNTGASAQGLLSLGSFAAAPINSALLHAAWAAGGRLLMSPNFTKLLANVGQAAARGMDASALYSKQYAALLALSRAEPALAADYRRVLELMPPPERLALPAPAGAAQRQPQVQR
jgi:hypothetical protein